MAFFRKYNGKSSSRQKTDAASAREHRISPKLSANLEKIKAIFVDTPDLVVRHLLIKKTQEQAVLIYISGITDSMTIHNHVLRPLLFENGTDESEAELPVSLSQIKKAAAWPEIEDALLNGDCVLFVANRTEACIFSTSNYPKRAIEDTKIESSLTGEHVGFTENGTDNVGLIRKHIRNRELKIKEMTIGDRGKLKVSLLYLADVANPDVLKELEKRIRNVKVDSIINAGVL